MRREAGDGTAMVLWLSFSILDVDYFPTSDFDDGKHVLNLAQTYLSW